MPPSAPEQRTPSVTIEVMAIADLLPDPGNPRAINDAAMARLHGSLEEHGLLDLPSFNRRTRQLIGGHQRVERLRAMGYTHVPTIVGDMDEGHQWAANAALNADFGRYDLEKLGLRLRAMETRGLDPDLSALPPFVMDDALRARLDAGSARLKSEPVRALGVKAEEGLPDHTSADGPAGRDGARDPRVCPHCGGEL